MTDVLPADGLTESALLALAAALEQRSEHPLARAVMLRAEEDKLSVSEVSDFRALPGNGLTATLNDEELLGGSLSFISTKADVPQALRDKAEALAEEGKTPLLFARGGKLAGASLMPSPTIATLPCFCRLRMTLSLPSGRTPAMTSSTPA